MSWRGINAVIVCYMIGMSILLALQLAVSESGIGNELMPFGLPVLTAASYARKRLPDLTIADLVVIFACIMIIANVSFAVHWLAPERLENQYAGLAATFTAIPTLLFLIERREQKEEAPT